mmetsp:Transcript_42447/g.68920  ORF Transcript_42447/g.68920 Transcript_42447/m.68920 type:complete len:580 (-) Transcript_42447:138-1877(-)
MPTARDELAATFVARTASDFKMETPSVSPKSTRACDAKQGRPTHIVNFQMARMDPGQLPGAVKFDNEKNTLPAMMHGRRRSVLKQIKSKIFEQSVQGMICGGMLAKKSAITKNPSQTHKSLKSIMRDTTYKDGESKTERYPTDIIPDMDEKDRATKKGVYYITVILCVSFFILKTVQPFILDLSRENGVYPFRPSTAIWFSRIPLVVFFYIWCVLENETLNNPRDWRKSIPYIFVALCTVANVLAIYLTIESLGSAVYSVLKNLNLPFTAVLMVTWARKRISIVQWTCVLAITLGLVIYEADVLKSSSPQFGYIYVLLGVVSSSCEGILLQIAASKLRDMSFIKQSFFYHFYSLILSSILMFGWDYNTVFGEHYGPFKGWSWIVAIYIICIVPLVVMKHAVAGLASAVVVKLIVSATTVSSFMLAMLALGETATLTEVLSCCQICVLLVTYQMGGELTEAKAVLTSELKSIHMSRIRNVPISKSSKIKIDTIMYPSTPPHKGHHLSISTRKRVRDDDSPRGNRAHVGIAMSRGDGTSPTRISENRVEPPFVESAHHHEHTPTPMAVAAIHAVTHLEQMR